MVQEESSLTDPDFKALFQDWFAEEMRKDVGLKTLHTAAWIAQALLWRAVELEPQGRNLKTTLHWLARSLGGCDGGGEIGERLFRESTEISITKELCKQQGLIKNACVYLQVAYANGTLLSNSPGIKKSRKNSIPPQVSYGNLLQVKTFHPADKLDETQEVPETDQTCWEKSKWAPTLNQGAFCGFPAILDLDRRGENPYPVSPKANLVVS
ncbi:hypothetical protein STEG23_013264 [Scotinomys teguina]